ncbi:MAG: sigma-70 family RNA polymerase sigma factor [Clostridiales bacterium]|nr:sigma-70 family RNA polymerase sigma factor [Clostridiales bacterium]
MTVRHRLKAYIKRFPKLSIANEILMYFRSLRKSAQDVFISDPIETDKDGNSLTLQDIMSDDESIYDRIDLRLKSEHMYKLIKEHLTNREKDIIVMRYGLFCRKPLTQREVANKLDISRSYVSRIEKKAISVLRKNFDREGF